MGYRSYRIQHTPIEGGLSVVVTGMSNLAAAGCIARDIAAMAARESVSRVLVDLRWLEDQVGMRAFLSLPWLRVAVLDVGENDASKPITEPETLRYFASVSAAMRWLRADPRSARGDRKGTNPAGPAFAVPLATWGG
jgi:hypothetical protein